jgi:predicted kinase
MRKKTSLTIVERAMVLVPEFKSRAVKLEHQVVLRGQSASTLNNYIRRIALFVIHFEKLPEQVSEDEINEYRLLWHVIPRRLRAAVSNTWFTVLDITTVCWA